jgi:hypothetical protein
VTDHRIWPATNGPDVSFNDGVGINLGTEFYVASTGWVIGARFYRGTASVSPDDLRLYRVDSPGAGTELAVIASPSYSGTGWIEVDFATPVQLAALQAYKIVGHFPDHYTATGGYWATGGPGQGGITDAYLTAPDTTQAAGGAQATFATGTAGTYPTGTFNGGNYWVDIVITDIDPDGDVTFDGSAPAAANATGSLAAARSLTGSSDGAAAATATLAAARNLTATATAANSGTAALTVTPADVGPRHFTAGQLTTCWSAARIDTSWRAGPIDA